MQRYLVSRGEADPYSAGMPTGKFVTYLTTVFAMAHPEEKANSYIMREMRTMAEALDCLICGDLDRAGDIMVQRFKALEASKG
eukprot:1823624-Heterocapsa_arctica.AAC.1